MFDPDKQTNPEFKRRVFVGIGAGAAAVGTTLAAALAQTPPPAVAENDPSIQGYVTIASELFGRNNPPLRIGFTNAPTRRGMGFSTLAFFHKYLTA